MPPTLSATTPPVISTIAAALTHQPTSSLVALPLNMSSPGPPATFSTHTTLQRHRHDHLLAPRDNSISTTPLVVIPFLCTAIFALIVICTIRQHRYHGAAHHQPVGGGSSSRGGQNTREWVRSVRGTAVKSGKNGRKGRSHGGGRSGSDSAGMSDGGISIESGSESADLGGGVDGKKRLSTIVEEGESGRWAGNVPGTESVVTDTDTDTAAVQREVASEKTPRRSNRRERERGGKRSGSRRAQLKAGRRASSTIWQV